MEPILATENNPVLYLIPCTLGDNPPMEVLPLTIRKTIEPLTHFIVENEKEARRFIKRIAPQKKQDELVLFPLNKFSNPMELQTYLAPMENGLSMGLLSDAGCPGIADPGAVMVKRAHAKSFIVKPLVGPSSILLAMMASGMNGQSFAFNGYLPIDKQERSRAIKRLEKHSGDYDQTQAFIETPYRNEQLLNDFIKTLSPTTQLSIACDLTLPTEWVKSAPIKQWRKIKVDLQKRPAIFLFHKELAI
ncbi:SAM-dependent methyltransferase [Flavobacteriaceae bacterium]|mgnify:CR=1 FL=1|nr:SAM-dependent methyltransferase [Flavobacteriaceae bacterium]MDB9823745.1 SAM-dependent methyltransferase [Flavobacteriaceae bacterium]